jgi:hypothetical protein
LNLLLPGATLCAIAAASVGQDEEVAGLRVALAALLQPPFAETGDGEGGRFVGSSHENRAAVGLSIVDAIGNGDAFGSGTEVMIVDSGGGPLPFGAGVLKLPINSLFLASTLRTGSPRFSN